MSEVIEEEILCWTARHKSALVLEILQRKTTVATASHQFDLTPAEIVSSVEVCTRIVQAPAQGSAGGLLRGDAGDLAPKKLASLVGKHES